jgi:hypothetical protein
MVGVILSLVGAHDKKDKDIMCNTLMCLSNFLGFISI